MTPPPVVRALRLRHNAGTGWQVIPQVIIEQGILQAKNITNFF